MCFSTKIPDPILRYRSVFFPSPLYNPFPLPASSTHISHSFILIDRLWPVLVHPLALFSLRPYQGNERAERVVSHQNNEHNVSTLPCGTQVLDIRLHLRGKSIRRTLGRLGQGDGVDVYLDESSISRVQCSFEVNLDTGVIMLHDYSSAESTQLFGEDAMPFERERDVRKVLVQKGLSTRFRIAVERRDPIEFELVWHCNPTQTAEIIKTYNTLACGRGGYPRIIRIVTPGQQQPEMRYVLEGTKLGSGQFGDVYKAIDVDSGRFMAVKILKQRTKALTQEAWENSIYHALKREVEHLSKCCHPHIVDYIASQGWNGLNVEIFMGLKQGTLESLVKSGANPVGVANSVYPQMLQALDCIASMGIVHRDVKPENILYTLRSGGEYQFQLGDFGLCNRVVDATTVTGTPLYMSPEICRGEIQTQKVDVWSFFVTMMWILDAEGFRLKSNRFKSVFDVHQLVVSAASNSKNSGSKNPGHGNYQPVRTCFCSTNACQAFQRSRTQHSTEPGPRSHQHPFSGNRCRQNSAPTSHQHPFSGNRYRQSSAPSSSFPADPGFTTKADRLAKKCEYTRNPSASPGEAAGRHTLMEVVGRKEGMFECS